MGLLELGHSSAQQALIDGQSMRVQDAAGQHSQGPTYVQEQQQLRQAFLQVLSVLLQQYARLGSKGAP